MPAAPPASRLVLGTAQLGLTYGVANTTVLGPSEKQALLAAAVDGGVTCIDTARAYGNSEVVIGEFVRSGGAAGTHIVTKLSPLAGLDRDASPSAVRAATLASLSQSREALGLDRLQTVLLHRASQLTEWQGEAWETLLQAVGQGEVARIGVSVQSADELKLALQIDAVSHIQLPFNILDWRWDDAIAAIRQTRQNRPDLTIHVRSLLLQGLLLTRDDEPWARAGVSDRRPVQQWLSAHAERFGGDVANLCMAYANAHDWIDGLVVGVDNIEQLQANMHMLATSTMSAEEAAALTHSRPRLNEATLNPANWARTR